MFAWWLQLERQNQQCAGRLLVSDLRQALTLPHQKAHNEGNLWRINMNRYRTAIKLCVLASITVLGLLGAGCSGSGGDDPCDGWTCSDHGTCEEADGAASCKCDPFYEPSADGSQCISIVSDPCAEYTCAGHGRCRVDDQDQAFCECDQGWFPTEDKLDCIENNCAGNCGDMGCCGTRCCVPLPSNSAVIGELADNGISRSAPGSFNTDSECTAGSSLGGCELVAVAGPDMCVCRLDSLTVGGSFRVTGEAALVVLAYSTITVGGTVNLSASMGSSGNGAVVQPDEEAANWRGGKAGSNGTVGGNAGEPARPANLIPFEGGQVGQNGCGGTKGGGAGGALQLVAGQSITITGAVHASGGGGLGGQTDPDNQCLGGAAGGSGGSLLLEAPVVTYGGNFFANGGSGGGGGNNEGSTGENGRDAVAGTDPVLGGQGRDGSTCALHGPIEGGDGGQGSSGDSSGGDGQDYDHNQCEQLPYVGGGGGGGGAGRLRINTRQDCACTGTYSPSPSMGYLQGG
jgi:hypothetical protein